MPEVSIIIPTIGRKFFKDSYISAIKQNFDDIEIIVCDYGKNNYVQNILSMFPDKRVNYYKLPDPGRLEGYRKGIELANGKYIKLLLDDDVLLPESIAIMKKFLDEMPKVKLITSIRLEIDENNNLIKTPELNKISNIMKEYKLINGIKAGNLMLSYLSNYIGEPSTVLFRLEDLEEPFGRFSGIDALCNDDVATWLSLLLKGDLLLLSKPLSYFRVHINQTQRKKEFVAKGLIDWLNHIILGKERGYLRDNILFFQTLKRIADIKNLNQIIKNAEEKDKVTLIHLLNLLKDELKNESEKIRG